MTQPTSFTRRGRECDRGGEKPREEGATRGRNAESAGEWVSKIESPLHLKGTKKEIDKTVFRFERPSSTIEREKIKTKKKKIPVQQEEKSTKCLW